MLQAGTVVLADDHGRPRVKCGCGNPLLDPVATFEVRPGRFVREVEARGTLKAVTATPIGRKLSMRASIQCDVTFDGVRLGPEALLPAARGLRGPFSCLNEARYGIAWGAMGAARDSYEAALKYAQERMQFGRPLAGYQLTQEKLVNMLLEIQKGTLLALQLGRLKDAGKLRDVLGRVTDHDDDPLGRLGWRAARGSGHHGRRASPRAVGDGAPVALEAVLAAAPAQAAGSRQQPAAKAEPRFVPLPSVPLQDGVRAGAVLKAAVAAGFPGAMISTLPRGIGSVLDAPDLDPFWKAADDTGAVIHIHPAFDSGESRVHDYGLANGVGRVLARRAPGRRHVPGAPEREQPTTNTGSGTLERTTSQ